MAGFAFLSENVSILAWILSLRFYIVAFKLLRITIVPEGLLANTLIAAWDAGVAFGIFFGTAKVCSARLFPEPQRSVLPGAPSEP